MTDVVSQAFVAQSNGSIPIDVKTLSARISVDELTDKAARKEYVVALLLVGIPARGG